MIREASIYAKKNGEKGISARGIKKVTEVRTTYVFNNASADSSTGMSEEVQGLDTARGIGAVLHIERGIQLGRFDGLMTYQLHEDAMDV